MTPSMRVRRHGYYLMSLASIGLVVCFVLWIVAIVTGGLVQRGKPPGTDLMMTEFWLIAGIATVTFAAQWWALAGLRAIGRLLHGGDLISAAMAHAWKRFANALVIVAITTLVSFDFGDWRLGGPGGIAIGDARRIGFEIDATQAYFLVVACLVSHSIAWILKDAADLKSDNQGFV